MKIVLIVSICCVKEKRKLIRDQEGLDKLAECVKKLRKEKGFTQERLAYDSGVALSQVFRIESAQINPTVYTIFRLARTLEVPVSACFEFLLEKE